MKKKSNKMVIKIKDYKRKMSSEELQEHLKLSRGNGSHRSKKDYNRQKMKKVAW